MSERKVPKLRFAGFTDDWKQRKLGDVLTESRILGSTGKNAKKLTVKLWRKGAIAKEDTQSGSEATQYFIRQSGQFIYGKLDFLNQAFAIIPDELNGYESTLDAPAFDIDKSVDANFLLEFIARDTFYLHYGSMANGSRKAKRVHVQTVLNMPFIAPTLAEQQAIGEFFKQLDDTIAFHQREWEKYKNLKISYLEKMFTQENENKPQLRFPNFTDAWKQRQVKYLCEISTGKSNTQDKVDNGTYPFYVRSATIETSHRYLFDEEAVLTVGDGVGTGKVFHYVNGKYDLHQRVYRIFNFSSEISGKYFYYYFSVNFYHRVMMMTAKTSVDSVRLDMIADMEISYPIIEEQLKIVQFFEELDDTIAFHQRELEKYKNLKNGYLKQMFV